MTGEQTIKLVAIVGPTASGKSALAMEIAAQYGGEIVACDSMQVYRQMDVGTAKPTQDEMTRVRHHLVDVAEPTESFSAAAYVSLAADAIKDISARGKLPVLCGGTGLYLDGLLRGGYEETPSDEMMRAELYAYAEENGADALHRRLLKVDPESAAATHANNVKRVVRALEIYELTGKTKSEWDRASREQPSPYDATVIGLRYPDRGQLYARIDRRVDRMLEDGLLAETERLMRLGVFEQNGTAAQAIGYKELLGDLRGQGTLDEAVEELKRSTRRYAKRQLTWFSAKD
jgi:tRNA dimethylallyltransferase